MEISNSYYTDYRVRWDRLADIPLGAPNISLKWIRPWQEGDDPQLEETIELGYVTTHDVIDEGIEWPDMRTHRENCILWDKGHKPEPLHPKIAAWYRHVGIF